MFLFFDDQIENIRDVQTAFPSSTCVLIDPRPVERDLREFEGNPYYQKMPMNRGFHEEHMAMVGKSLLVLDWDKTLSVVEGIHMPRLQSFEDIGMPLEAVCHVILGGHARISLLKSFFKHVKVVIVTNNPCACPPSQTPYVFGDDPACYN